LTELLDIEHVRMLSRSRLVKTRRHQELLLHMVDELFMCAVDDYSAHAENI